MTATILIVDDEPSLREVIADYLQDAGYQTCVASNGHEGLAQLKQFQPDLVISDVWMPGMDGYTFCKLVKQATTTPVILLTGVPQEVRWFREVGAGADDYIAKPPIMRDFLARIEELLSQRWAGGEVSAAS